MLTLTAPERAALADIATAPAATASIAPSATTAALPSPALAVPQLSAAAASTSSNLPAFEHREAILGAICDSKVALLRGATGCGKSTQLPKCLLLECAATTTPCSIVVTQPRRLAAMALAERVSSELGEEKVGGVCGYRIRGESRCSARTCLTFVTTGVILRQLEDDPLLERVTHLIVDEVHERSVDTDLLLLVLRRAIANGTTAKILLMSATVDAAP